jgi:hypothetical protein
MTFGHKKFCKTLTIFLLPLLGCWIAIEVFYRAVPNNYTIKHDYISEHREQIEVLLFGDSHCMYGLNPLYFKANTFNISNVSQTIFFDKLLFDQYIDQLPKLKQVVFCIEYTNLSQADDTQDDVFRKYYYSHFMRLKVPTISRFDPGAYSITLAQDFSMTNRLLKKYIKTGKLYQCHTNGWGYDYKKENRIAPELVAEHRAFIQEDGSLDFVRNSQRIRQMIDCCKKRNIGVLIVSMPQTRVFENYLNPEKLKKIVHSCEEFERQNENVSYLNLFADIRFTNEDFYDADHLNDSGAVKCSKIVNAALERIRQPTKTP